MTLEELKGKQIAILGLGINNRHLAEYLKKQGIGFEIFSDWQSPAELTGKIDEFDIVFRTPGLPYLSEPIQQAKEKGVIIYSQTKLFFDLCPCPIIGVTGTKGKGTTATLLAKILEAAGEQVWLSGNIGADPFSVLDETDVNDLVVLELSSFQLQDLHKSPHMAVVLKTTVEHLDHHKSREEYVAAKANIISHQTAEDIAVLNFNDATGRQYAKLTAAQIWWNSIEEAAVERGSIIQNGKLVLVLPEERLEIMPTRQVGLLGHFNLENITASLAAAAALGATDQALLSRVIAEFKGLPHRLEQVTEKNKVKYYNDSFSTTADTAIAALSAFDAPIVLIVGGSEKNADYTELAQAIAKGGRVKALLGIGTTGPKIVDLTKRAGFTGKIITTDLSNMEEIVKAASEQAVPGDIVLLSPASASFDMFTDYKHRGELFKKYVSRL